MFKKLLFTFFTFLLSIPSDGQNVPQYVPTDSLVGWWPFTGNANDVSGNGLNGTVYNSPSLVSDRFGNANSAYSFNWTGASYGGNWQKIEIPTVVTTGEFTINAWIKPSDYCWPNNSIKSAMIVGGSSQCANSNGDIRFALSGNDGALGFRHNSQNGASNTGAIDLNVWQMTTLIVKSDSVSMYVDATKIASFAHNLNPGINSCLSVGLHHQGNGHWYYFNGAIDDIGIWNRALTDCEIQNLYNGSLSNCEQGTNSDTTVCLGDTISLGTSVSPASLCTNGIGEWEQILTSSDLAGYSISRNSSYSFDTTSGIYYSVNNGSIVALDLINKSVAPISSSGGSSSISNAVYNYSDGKLYGHRVGRDVVYSVSTSGGAWASVGTGSFDGNSYSSLDFYNAYDERIGFFGGYGYYAVKNWIYESTASGWVNSFANNNNCNSLNIPSKRIAGGIAPNKDFTKMYVYSGMGNCSGSQTASSCTLGSAWATDVGVYCWLKDLWEYDFTNDQFTNILPNNHASIPIEGEFTYDYNRDIFYLLGGWTPSPTYQSGYGNTALNSNMVFRYDRGNNAGGFDTVTICGTPPPIGAINSTSGIAIYDSPRDRIIWLRADGVWAINLSNSNSHNSLAYLWSTGDTTSTINVSPSTTTKYWVQKIAGTDTVVDTITVNVLDPTIITSSSYSVCESDSVLLYVPNSNSNITPAQSCGDLPSNLKNGLVAWYPFCGNADDESGNNNNGIVYGPTLTSDRFNSPSSAYLFDGGTDLIATSTQQSSTNTYTVSFWTQVDSIYPAWLIVHGGNQAGAISYGFDNGVRMNTDGVFRQYVYNGSQNWGGTDTAVTGANQWYNIVFSLNSTGMKMYVNGSLSYHDPTVTTNQNLNGYWRIGGCTHPGHVSLFGKIDDIGIWNRAITPSEVSQLYNIGSSIIWSTGETSDSIWVSPSENTTYWVERTVNGVTCSDTISVEVLNVTASASSSTVCVGDSVTLEANVQSTYPSLTDTSLYRFMGYFDGKAYYESKFTATYQRALINAQDIGGELLKVNNSQENSFISTNMSNPLLLGANDSLNEGTFTWADGTALNYSNWLSGEPNNAGNGSSCRPYGEDYIILLPGGSWNDVPNYYCGTQTPKYYGLTVDSASTVSNPSILWSTGDTTLSIIVSPTETTSYWVKQLGNSGYCSDTITVTVLNTNITASSTTVCESDSVLLYVPSSNSNSTPSQSCADLPSNLENGLVAWYPFCGNANDESGNGYNGSVYGASLTTDRNGISSHAYSFDGDDKIDIGNPALLGNNPTSHTQSAWVLFNDFSSNNVIGSKRHADDGSDWATARSQPDSVVWFYADDKSYVNAPKATTSSLNRQTWYHFTFVKNSNSYLLYLNGSLVDSSYDTHSMGGSNYNYIIGAQLAWPRYMNGKLDDFGLWNRALTAAEIVELYNVGSNTTWSTGETGDSVWVSPTENTTYWVERTVNGVTCSDSISIEVLNVNASASSSTICAGDSVTLSMIDSAANTSILIDSIGQGINSNWSKVMPTTPGNSYRLRIQGEMTWGTYCPSLANDPAYVKPGYYSATTTALPRAMNTSSASALYVLGASINRPQPDVYNPTTHAYDYYFTATSNSIQVGWHDNALGDNCGSASFALYEEQSFNSSANILWSTGDTSETIQVAPTETTTYWVQKSTDNGSCSDTITVTVVNAQITASSTTLCESDSVLLYVPSSSSTNNTTPSQSCADLPSNLENGLVAWYPFCGNANDESGNGNNGTVNGATLTTDRIGNLSSAYEFNGISYIEAPNNAVLNFTSSHTYSVWVRITGSNTWQHFITRNDGASHPLLQQFYLRRGSGGSIELQNSPDGNIIHTTNTLNSTNPQWHHIVAVVDVNTLKSYLYLDGVKIDSSSLNTPLNYNNNNGKLWIGVENPIVTLPSGPQYFQGKLDDIGLWNRAITPSEVSQLYYAGTSTTWSTGETGDSVWVKPSETTSYWVERTVNGVTCSDTVVIEVLDINISASATTICAGDSLVLNATSSNSSGTVQWSNGDTTASILVHPTETTTYWVQKSTDNGTCNDSITITVLNSEIQALQSTDCQSDSVLLYVINAGPNVIWSSGETNDSIWVIPSQNSSYWVENSKHGVTCSDTITIRALQKNLLKEQYFICGETDSISTIFNYDTYQWSTGDTSRTIVAQDTGLYWITVIDSNCTFTDTTTVIHSNLSGSIQVLDSNLCFGDSSATLALIPSGGIGALSIQWNTGDSTLQFNDLPAGNYTVYVEDTIGCSYRDSITIIDPPLLSVNISANIQDNGLNISCNGGIDGIVHSLVSGGVQPYTYLWSNNSTLDSAAGLGAGTAWLLLTDANGCSASDTITLTEPAPLMVNASAISNFNGYNISCFGEDDGQANVTPTGGNGNFAYLWSNNDNNALALGLSAATYSVTVTDSLGCSASDTVSLTQPNALNTALSSPLNALGNHLDCYLDSTAVVVSTNSGGVQPYTYLWSNSSTADSAAGLGAGSTWLQLTDANGCTVRDTISLTEPSPVAINATGISNFNGYNISCFGGDDGQANVTATGGNGNYTYLWSNSDNKALATGLSAATYSVTVTDSLGCSTSDTVSLTEPIALSTVLSSPLNTFGNHLDCYFDSTAVVHTANHGGVQPYTYLWSNNSTLDSAGGLGAGTTWVLLTDGNGCTTSDTITLTQPAPLNVNTIITSNFNGYNISCFGEDDGQANVTATGGNGNFAYLWSNNDNNALALGLSAETYSVTVTDSLGCSASDTVSLTQPNALNVAPLVTDNQCYGETLGLIDPNPSGGAGGYLTYWSTGDTANYLNGLGNGLYIFTIVDGNQCILTDSTSIVSPDSISTSVEVIPQTCRVVEDGEIIIATIGGVGPYDYSLDWVPVELPIDSLASGQYLLSTSDAYGCIRSLLIDVPLGGNDCFQIPNMFSPNADGYNDVFNIQTSYMISYEIIIYNSLGQKMYQSTSVGSPWDGFSNGIEQPSGDYYYVIVTDNGNKIFGYVTLIR